MKPDLSLAVGLSSDGEEEDEGNKTLLRKVSTKKQLKSKVRLAVFNQISECSNII